MQHGSTAHVNTIPTLLVVMYKKLNGLVTFYGPLLWHF
jgi:hypothetical protein